MIWGVWGAEALSAGRLMLGGGKQKFDGKLDCTHFCADLLAHVFTLTSHGAGCRGCFAAEGAALPPAVHAQQLNGTTWRREEIVVMAEKARQSWMPK
eukprot:gene3495-971_t